MAQQILKLRTLEDVIRVRQACVRLAVELGLDGSDRRRVATAAGEIARNVLQHSGDLGEVALEEIDDGTRRGIQIVVRDQGRGIADVVANSSAVASASVISLGAGLAGAKWLMDTFEIDTAIGRGTTVRMVKWQSSNVSP